MIGRVGSYAPVSRRLKSNAKRQVISMYLKNLAAAGMSALLLFSGAVSAGAAETVPATHDSETYAAAVETLASNGLAAASATSLQAADGLQLAQEAGLLDESGEELYESIDDEDELNDVYEHFMVLLFDDEDEE